MHRCQKGEMAEWSNALVLKTSVQQCTGGSNPSLSAKQLKAQPKGWAFFILELSQICMGEVSEIKKIIPLLRKGFLLFVRPPLGITQKSLSPLNSSNFFRLLRRSILQKVVFHNRLFCIPQRLYSVKIHAFPFFVQNKNA